MFVRVCVCVCLTSLFSHATTDCTIAFSDACCYGYHHLNILCQVRGVKPIKQIPVSCNADVMFKFLLRKKLTSMSMYYKSVKSGKVLQVNKNQMRN